MADVVFHRMLACLLDTMHAAFPEHAQALGSVRGVLDRTVAFPGGSGLLLARFGASVVKPCREDVDPGGRDAFERRSPEVFRRLQELVPSVPIAQMHERAPAELLGSIWHALDVMNMMYSLAVLLPPELRRQIDGMLRHVVASEPGDAAAADRGARMADMTGVMRMLSAHANTLNESCERMQHAMRP